METKKRLISLNEALEATHKEVWWTESEASAIRSFLLKLPRADAVEVVHGRWIRKPIGKYTGVDEVCCSICGCFVGVVASDTAFREAIEGMNYCPNCGAKMDGDGNG